MGWAGKGNGDHGWQVLDTVPAQHLSQSALPEFLSGHSAFSAAGATVLRLFTGSNAFGDSVTFAPRSSKIEPGLTPSHSITLRWETFADAANQAGISRRYGGIHFKAADLTGRAIGRIVGYEAYIKAESLWSGRK